MATLLASHPRMRISTPSPPGPPVVSSPFELLFHLVLTSLPFFYSLNYDSFLFMEKNWWGDWRPFDLGVIHWPFGSGIWWVDCKYWIFVPIDWFYCDWSCFYWLGGKEGGVFMDFVIQFTGNIQKVGIFLDENSRPWHQGHSSLRKYCDLLHSGFSMAFFVFNL